MKTWEEIVVLLAEAITGRNGWTESGDREQGVEEAEFIADLLQTWGMVI